MAFIVSIGEVSADLAIENILNDFSEFVNAEGRSGFPISSEVNEEKMLSEIMEANNSMEGPVNFIGDFLEANENDGFCRYKRGAKGEDGCSVDFEVRFMIDVPEGELADIVKTLTKYFEAVVDMNKKKKFWEISTRIPHIVESGDTKQYVVKQHSRVRSSNAYAVYDYVVRSINRDTAVMYGAGKDLSKTNDEGLLNKMFEDEAERKTYSGKDANKFAGMTLVKRVKQGDRQYYAFYSICSAELKGEAECNVVKGGFINMDRISLIENECNKTVVDYVKSTIGDNGKKPRFSNNRELMEKLGLVLPPPKWETNDDDGL